MFMLTSFPWGQRKRQLAKFPKGKRQNLIFWFTSNAVMLLLFMLPLPLRPTSALLCLPCVLGYWPLWTMSHGLLSKSLTSAQLANEKNWKTYFGMFTSSTPLLIGCTPYLHILWDDMILELWCWRRLLRVPWTARRSKQSILRRSVLGVLWKVWCCSWNSNPLATRCEELTHLKRPWCWERLRAGGEGDDRGWDGRMASPTQWTWVWVGSRS